MGVAVLERASGRSRALTGLGRLLAQQLVAAGEQVLDVQPKLAARVRLLATGTVNKNDPNDARSVAVAAMRSPDVRAVRAEDHPSVMRIWAQATPRPVTRTNRDRLPPARHALRPRRRRVCQANIGHPGRPVLERIEPVDARWTRPLELAHELLADLRRVDEQRRDGQTTHHRASSPRSGTTVTQVYGAGPVVAATVVGDVGDDQPVPDP